MVKPVVEVNYLKDYLHHRSSSEGKVLNFADWGDIQVAFAEDLLENIILARADFGFEERLL